MEAVKEMDGQKIAGERVRCEIAKSTGKKDPPRGGRSRSPDRDRGYGRDRSPPRGRSPPYASPAA